MALSPQAELTQQQLEIALKLARISIDSTERMLQLQLTAAKDALEDSAKVANKLTEVKDPQSALAVRAALTEQAMGSMLGLSRNIYELAAQTQAELAKVSEARLGNLQQEFLAGFDKLGQSAPAGSDLFSAGFKSSIAASQAAFDSLTKASRQVAEFADASIKAASTATADAVKSSSRK